MLNLPGQQRLKLRAALQCAQAVLTRGQRHAPVPVLKQAQEFTEQPCPECPGLFDMRWRLSSDLYRVDLAPQFIELTPVHRCMQPAMDHRRIHLEVKLQAIDIVSIAESLVPAAWRAGQVHCAIGNGEGVTMPLEYLFAGSKVAEQRIVPAICSGFYIVPADFLDRVGSDMGAERACQQLCAQTDAEYRLARRDRCTDSRDFNGQMRVVVHLVAVHRTAEHDQPMVAAEIRNRIRLSAEVLVADAKAGIPQQRVEGAEYFVRDVLENKQAMHCGLRLATGLTQSRQRISAARSSVDESLAKQKRSSREFPGTAQKTDTGIEATPASCVSRRA